MLFAFFSSMRNYNYSLLKILLECILIFLPVSISTNKLSKRKIIAETPNNSSPAMKISPENQFEKGFSNNASALFLHSVKLFTKRFVFVTSHSQTVTIGEVINSYAKIIPVHTDSAASITIFHRPLKNTIFQSKKKLIRF